MTPKIHEEYQRLKIFTDMMIPVLLMIDAAALEKFENDARVWANGTMSPIAAHSMSIQDMMTSEKNLKHAIEVSRCLRQLKSLLIREGEDE